jgi:hypothetical protein
MTFDNSPIIGCEGCKSTSGRLGCHGLNIKSVSPFLPEISEDLNVSDAVKQDRVAIGELLDRTIMKTDNRVTKLWVLADFIKVLKEGNMPV